MGLYASLLIVLPGETFERITNERKLICWNIVAVITLGRVSGATDGNPLHKKGAHERAGLCMIDCVWEGLGNYVTQHQRASFAPAFVDLFNADQFRVIPDHEVGFVQQAAGGYGFEAPIPRRDVQKEHNRARLSYSGTITLRELIGEVPWIWAPCTDVSSWITQSENRPSARVLLEGNAEAHARFTTWKTCIHEMGKVGAHCIFATGIEAPLLL